MTTVRQFLDKHPDEALDLWTPDGRIPLEPAQAYKLRCGDSVIRLRDKGVRYAELVDAVEVLDLMVASAFYQHGAWRVSASCDPFEKQAREATERLTALGWRLSV